MADRAPLQLRRGLRAGCGVVALCGLLTPLHAVAESPRLHLQSIQRASEAGCGDFPELDEHVEAELKQLTGRIIDRIKVPPGNPAELPTDSAQVLSAYVEPLDNGWWRARLWLKDGQRAQLAVRDAYYRTQELLAWELPHDAAALLLLPDWSHTSAASPWYCSGPARSPAPPEDACDLFSPPPGCRVPFDCPPGDHTPRCSSGPSCGVPGKPPCAQAAPTCRARDWRVSTGIAAAVAGGFAITLAGALHFASTDGHTHASTPAQVCGGSGYPAEPGSCYFNGMPAAISSYVAGGALLGAGAILLGHWGLHAKTTACRSKD